MARRHSHALGMTGVGALATALVSASFNANAEDSAQRPRPNWDVKTSSTNKVGCIETTVAKPQVAGQSGLSAFLYTRPPELDIESLTDSELRSCGLPSRRALGDVPRISPKYQAWLAEAHARLTAKQVLPWEEGPLRPGDVEPPPMKPTAGRPPVDPRMLHHSSLQPSSVAPGSAQDSDPYNPAQSYTFSGREILDYNYTDNGQAAAPTIMVTVHPSSRYTLPSPTQNIVQTQIGSWVDYADQEDSGSGGTSLAQIGVSDQVFNTVAGGSYHRTIFPFVEFYPDPPTVIKAIKINPSDPVSLVLDYGGPSTFGFTITDGGADGETVTSGFVNLYRTGSCASGNIGSGTPITICNNGDLAEWFLEDDGQESGSGPQVPPTTPAIKNVDFDNPSVTWANGDFEVPSNSGWCGDCYFGFGELELYDTTTGGAVMSITPSWDNGDLKSHYVGPPAPGFNWPS